MGLSNLTFSATNVSSGLDADKPLNPTVGQIYVSTDTGDTLVCYIDGIWSSISSKESILEKITIVDLFKSLTNISPITAPLIVTQYKGSGGSDIIYSDATSESGFAATDWTTIRTIDVNTLFNVPFNVSLDVYNESNTGNSHYRFIVGSEVIYEVTQSGYHIWATKTFEFNYTLNPGDKIEIQHYKDIGSSTFGGIRNISFTGETVTYDFTNVFTNV